MINKVFLLPPMATALMATVVFALSVPMAQGAGAFLFSNSDNRTRITHPIGYSGGVNEHLVITVGILPITAHRDAMVTPTLNAIHEWNSLQGVLPNVFEGPGTGIPPAGVDFESVLLHELGHALGMAHTNLATESGLAVEFQDFAKSTRGNNGVFDLNAGPDGIPGSRTDQRGDDLPLLWFHKATNDPFFNPAIVDSTSYSLNLADLPPESTYASSGGLGVAPLLGYPPSESVLQQGTRFDEAQRRLTPGCVAVIRLALAGFDRIQGTADDYTFELQYVGFTPDADITIGFDDSQTSFAITVLNASIPASDHYVVSRAQVFFNATWKWHFNPISRVSIPDQVPDTWALF